MVHYTIKNVRLGNVLEEALVEGLQSVLSHAYGDFVLVPKVILRSLVMEVVNFCLVLISVIVVKSKHHSLLVKYHYDLVIMDDFLA